MERKIHIIADSIEQFTEIADAINKLPEQVRCQIETAGGGLGGMIGIECIIKTAYSKESRICLPKTTQIKTFGDYVGVYAGDYFFKIYGDLANIEYIFLDNLK